MASIVKLFSENIYDLYSLQEHCKAVHDNHRLLLYHDNTSLRYDNHTINIIAHH